MKYVFYISAIVLIHFNCMSNTRNLKKEKMMVNLDSLYAEFIKDTGNIQKLRYCDSLIYLSFKEDSLNRSTLKMLKVTRCYLGQFDFVLNRLYPKLLNDDRLKDYEMLKLFELKGDSINFCQSLKHSMENLKYIDLNNTANIEYIVAYLDLVYIQNGEDFTQNLIENDIKNDSLLLHPFYLKNFTIGAKKWHKNIIICK